MPAGAMGPRLSSLEAGTLTPPARDVPRRVVDALQRGLSPEPSRRFRDMPALLAALKGKRRGSGLVVGGVLGGSVLGLAAMTLAEPDVVDPCASASDALRGVWNAGRREALSQTFAARRPSFGVRTGAAVASAIDAWTAEWSDVRARACRAHASAEIDAAAFDAQMLCLDRHRGELGAMLDRVEAWDDDGVESALGAAFALPEPSACAVPEPLAPPEPAVAAEVDAVRGELREAWAEIERGRFSAASRRVSAARARAEATGYRPLAAELDLALAHAAGGEGDLALARDAALDAALVGESTRHDVVVAQAWTALVEVEDAAGRHVDAVEHAPKALGALERLGARPGLEASLRNALGIALDNLGRYDDAQASLRRALELRTARFGDGHPALTPILTNLGNLARNRRRYAEALALHQEALSIDQAALGDEHPAMGRHHHNVARLLLLTGDDESAQAHYEEALRIKTATWGPEHVEVARTHNSLGLLFAARGDADAARTHYVRALEIYVAADHPERGLVLFNLGLQDQASGDAEAALAWFERARSVIEQQGGGESRQAVELRLAIADAHVSLGQRAKARRLYLATRPLADALGDAALVEHAERGVASTRPKPVRPAAPEPRPPAAPASSDTPRPGPESRPDPTSTPTPTPTPPGSGAYAPGPGFDPPTRRNRRRRRK